MKTLKMAAGVVAALVVIVSATLAVESRYAKECEVAEVSTQLQKYQVENSIDRNQERIWTTQDRLREQPNDISAQKRLRELEAEKVRLEQRRKELNRK